MKIALLVTILWLVANCLQAKIVFHSNRDGNWEVYVMRSDGAPHEWNPLLPVSPQGLVPTRWGEIKTTQ